MGGLSGAGSAGGRQNGAAASSPGGAASQPPAAASAAQTEREEGVRTPAGRLPPGMMVCPVLVLTAGG